MPLKVKREREEPCKICDHYHDVRPPYSLSCC